MRIVVAGGAGRTGRAVVDRGLSAGYDMVAFARRWSGDAPSGLTVALGDATDESAVRGAVEGAGAVISTLGAPGLGPTTVLSDATRALAGVLAATGPPRLVVVMTVGVLLTKVDPTYAHVTDEHRKNLEMLREGQLDWVAVVAPEIVDAPANGLVEVREDARGPTWQITRGDLADVLLAEASGTLHHRALLGVSNAPDAR